MAIAGKFLRLLSLAKNARCFPPGQLTLWRSRGFRTYAHGGSNYRLSCSMAAQDRGTNQPPSSPAEATDSPQPDGENGGSAKFEENLKAAVEKCTETEEELRILEDKYKRALADNENLRARMVRQLEEAKSFGVQSLCKDLLEVADILQIAADSVASEVLHSGPPELRDMHSGVLMTKMQLMKIFSRYGVQPLNPEGDKFDPNFHEAVFQVSDPNKTPGTVAVVQKIGYTLHDRCLRAAQVGVVKP